MSSENSVLISGNEAVALAACHAGVMLGTAYPGTPSTEIMEELAALGSPAQWCPNEKVAYEVALGGAFAHGARTLAAMKHVGLNVAADPLFTSTYTGVSGGMVVVSTDDPGMASSQNEQDNRRYAVAAGIPMVEPADSQEAYDFVFAAYEISERWRLPVMLRMTTRVCHSKGVVRPHADPDPRRATHFEHDLKGRVMIPGYARPAHRRLRAKLAEIYEWNETSPLNHWFKGDPSLGIISSGVAFVHAREAAPTASMLKLGMTYPLPLELIRRFVSSVDRCVVIEENDPYLVESIRAAGMPVEGKAEMYRFDELTVPRVRRILAGDLSPEPVTPPGKPPQLCLGCPHRTVMSVLHRHDCIICGDIGCYTLAVLPPLEAHDTCVCMGASVGLGLGLRHVLPPEEARRVVTVIGDSTFVHGGITGLVEMVYNPPKTGHVLIILDNGTTAMTGMQEHPGTGRKLNHEPTGRVVFEDLARTLGIKNVHVIDPTASVSAFDKLVVDSLASEELVVIIARKVCGLAAKKIEEWEKAAAAQKAEACNG
jgi:indolepyruvate ferredoxin oxidoreductase alpha subunit